MKKFEMPYKGFAGWEMTLFGVHIFRHHTSWLSEIHEVVGNPRTRRWRIEKVER